MELKIFKDKQEVAQNFTEFLTGLIASTEEDIHIALSGGSTPKIVFKELAGNTMGIDWSQVHFYWGYERCVPPTDAESNYGMTAELLLSKIEIPGENIHRIQGENDPEQEARRYGELLVKELQTYNGVPQFDLVILGMGDDGHTASIFPYQMHLWESAKNCEVAKHPGSGQKRITITGSVINTASVVAFLVTGAGKAPKVREIIQKEGDYKAYPASLVEPESGELYWFLDKDAAKEL
jgi:6-phosphogluconolactonase